MKKRKFKRYQEGGMTEEEAKKKGLEASKNERVGFFERLRMGNIDDPKSEAYKRFGAGRGRAESAPATPVAAPATSVAAPSSGSIAQAPLPEAAVQKFGMAPQMESPLAPPTVAPETSQRFPLAEEATKETVVTPRKKKPKTKTGSGASGFSTDEKGIAQRRMEGLETPKNRTGQGLTPYEKGKSIEEMGAMLRSGKEAMARKNAAKEEESKKDLETTRRRAAGMFQKTNEAVYGMKKGGAVKKYASGGSVSSASKRADGIAKRGKTKGRIF